MFKSYIKIAWRNLIRSKVFSLINMAGLAVSVTAFILMALYIEDELSFDRFHTNANNVYRIADDKQTPDLLLRSAKSAAPVAPALRRDFPEIRQTARLINAESLVKYNDKLFEERNMYFADAGLFKIFSFKLLKGNEDKALLDPNSVVITRATAAKYFGNAEPLGKQVTVDGHSMQVTGVIENVPANSHLQFDFLISMATAEQKGSGYDWLFTNWYSNNFYTYILLPQNYKIDKLTAQLSDFDKRHKEANGNTVHHYAPEKLTDIYLYSDRDDQAGKTGNITNLYIFSAIAVFMLLIACINFINLSTARSLTRAKEVAVKKVAGAETGQIIRQFLTESFLLTAMSLVISVLLAAFLMPFFNAFSGKSLSIHLFSPVHIMILVLLLISIGLLSGSYPAFVLSAFKPVTALKGRVSASAWSIVIRKSLVVFQFSISVVLIICSLVIYTQMNYLQHHDLGFTPSQTLVINFEGDKAVQQRLSFIKQELLRVPGVQNITASSNVPGDNNSNTWSMDFAKKTGDTVQTELPIYLTDYNYLGQYRIPVVAGRGFSEQYAADSTESMLINETALHTLGFQSAADAIGVKVAMYPTDAKITGVIKDFHFQSLQKPVTPLAVRILPFKFRLLSLEINTAGVQQTVKAIEAIWPTLAPQRPLEYSFLDETFKRQYNADIKFGEVFGIFTLLAIIIACLGLFGLALFSVQQRRKEIGIRKVLGAGIASITATLSKDFIALVSIGILIASPVSWYFMHAWLQDFAYRIAISWWVFVAAGLAAILIALLTILFQSIKAAVANPIKSLRTE